MDATSDPIDPRTQRSAWRVLVTLLACLALVGAACGGDDDEGGGGGLIAAAGGSDADSGGSDGGGFDDDGDIGNEILEEFGIDVDGDGQDFDIDDAEDILDSVSSDGGGSVTVGDVTYTFTTEFCVLSQDDYIATGPATGSDGSVAWVEIDRTYDTREELEEFFDPAFVDMLTDGGDFAESVTIAVDVGRTELYASAPDGSPAWYASTEFGSEEIEWSLDGTDFTASGEIIDDNYVALEFGEVMQFTAESSCG